MTAGATKRAKHSAPGQYLGFGLQPVRMCYHLLTAPTDSEVSLEHADDVAVHYGDGSLLLEQTKSALSQNPLSDWAVDLWKALANWLDTSSLPGKDDPSVSYRLYVSPPHAGAIAQAMHDVKTLEAAEAFVLQVSQAIDALGKKPGCYKYVKQFLDASKERQHHLICNISIESDTDDPVEHIRDLIRTTVAPAAMDTICAYAIGRAKGLAEDQIRQGKAGVVSSGDFQAEFRHFVAKNNLPALLPFAPMPLPGTLASVLASRPTFIRQLELISAPDDQRIRSVGDYLRASADKTHWAEAGLTFPDALEQWDSDLLEQHAAIRDELELTDVGLDAQGRGKLLYARCRQVRRPLDAREVADHFVHGSFHDLSERRELGWHRDFVTLLDKDD